MADILLLAVIAAVIIAVIVTAACFRMRTLHLRRTSVLRSKANHPAGGRHDCASANPNDTDDGAPDVIGPGHELYDMMMLAMEGNMVAAERGDDGEVRITSVRPVD